MDCPLFNTPVEQGIMIRRLIAKRAQREVESNDDSPARPDIHAEYAQSSPASEQLRQTVAHRGDKFQMVAYEKPARPDMAVVLSYFNWAGAIRIHQNLLLVANSLARAGIPYYIAEVAADDFALPPAPNVFQFHTHSYMFYKENLINMAVQRLPDTYTKLCFLDADILFEDPVWYTTISDCLETADVCKPYHVAKWLSAQFCEIPSRRCDSGHPGFAWAVRRDWFLQRGIFDLCILGSGDMLFQESLTARTCTIGERWGYLHEPYSRFLAAGSLPNRVVNAMLTIGHLFHGAYRKRQYHTRDKILHDILAKYGFSSIESLVYRREDGLLEWLPAYRDKLNAAFTQFFKDRDDDSVYT